MSLQRIDELARNEGKNRAVFVSEMSDYVLKTIENGSVAQAMDKVKAMTKQATKGWTNVVEVKRLEEAFVASVLRKMGKNSKKLQIMMTNTDSSTKSNRVLEQIRNDTNLSNDMRDYAETLLKARGE